jgi:hypothetical protein
MSNTSPIKFDEDLLDDFVSGETLKNACGSFYKPTAFDSSVSLRDVDNDTVFCKTESAGEFFPIMTQNPNARRRVVTHNSDISIDATLASFRPSNIPVWYAVNSTHPDPNIVPVPLGIANSHCTITTKIHHIKQLDTKGERSKLLYINHRPSTYPIERQPLMDLFVAREAKGESWFTIGSNRKGNTENDRGGGSSDDVIMSFLTEMIQHKFVLCPRGNGLDTHRLWEALYSRTVPITRYEDGHRNFTDLPILFVSDWSEVTEEFLHRKYAEFHEKIWDYSKLRASWWAKEFS